MRIGIIGTGMIGGTLATLLTRAGHDVTVSNSRGPDTLADVVSTLGGRGRAGTPSAAAADGEVVVVAIPFGHYAELPAAALAGKVVVDATNYYAGRDGAFPADGVTSSEVIAAQLPGARLIKAFNTIYWERLRDRGRPRGDAERLAIPVAGDDAAAKQLVAGLIDEIGFDAVDTGTLAGGGRRQQPGTAVYNVPLTAAQVRERLGG